MNAGEHRPLQSTVKLLQGAEPWLLVNHSIGSFKLPLTAELGEFHQGLLNAWRTSPKRARNAGVTVRVPLAEWLALQGLAHDLG